MNDIQKSNLVSNILQRIQSEYVTMDLSKIKSIINEQLTIATLQENTPPSAQPDWYEQSIKNHQEFLWRANEKGKLTDDGEICNFLCLALAGEVGELANLFKKSWRGDAISVDEYRLEMADIYTYLKHLAVHMNIDLDKAAEEKAKIVAQRLAQQE